MFRLDNIQRVLCEDPFLTDCDDSKEWERSQFLAKTRCSDRLAPPVQDREVSFKSVYVDTTLTGYTIF